MDIDLFITKHFKTMLEERGINEIWVSQTLEAPDKIEDSGDGTRHFLKKIKENDDRWLRVVINRSTAPNRAVTAFFDRRMRRET